MLDRLPEFIDPLQLAERRGVLNGRLPLSTMDRLAEMGADDGGFAEVELRFSKEGKIATVRGRIEATVGLVCQNCLGMIRWPVVSDVALGVVASLDEASLLPEPYEPLLLGTSKLALKELVEDELLLAVPTIPKHSERCLEKMAHKNRPVIESNEVAHENPFSVLAKLKHTGEK